MPEPYTGGCACGAIRFEIAGEPLGQNIASAAIASAAVAPATVPIWVSPAPA